MDMMLLGETIASDESGDTDYYGFWMPAGGNDGVAAVEVFLLSTASAFKVYLQTKSSDEADPGPSSNLIGNVTLSSTTPQLYKFDVNGAKDLVRYRVEMLDVGSVHLQFSQPLWSPN